MILELRWKKIQRLITMVKKAKTLNYLKTTRRNNFALSSTQPNDKGTNNKVAPADLVHNDELKQDTANIQVKNKTKKRIMDGCILFSRKIKPVIAVIFITVYWGAGLWRSAQNE